MLKLHQVPTSFLPIPGNSRGHGPAKDGVTTPCLCLQTSALGCRREEDRREMAASPELKRKLAAEVIWVGVGSALLPWIPLPSMSGIHPQLLLCGILKVLKKPERGRDSKQGGIRWLEPSCSFLRLPRDSIQGGVCVGVTHTGGAVAPFPGAICLTQQACGSLFQL